MRNRRTSSRSALAAAAARAYGAMEKDPALRCADDLAIRFLSGFFRFILLPGVRKNFVREYERRAPGVFFHHIARTKRIDALLSAELEAGTKQVVLLGAGFDSRAYRFAPWLQAGRVFEVDHPATSAEKRKRVARILGAAPAHVTFVPVDFTRQRAEERLLASGYDPSRVTLFVWEGVTPYLDAPAVEATLAMVSRAAHGSAVVFDYMYRSALDRPDPDTKKQLEIAEKMGEPYGFGIDADELAPLLGRHAIALEENLSAAALGARYLVGSDGAQWGSVCPILSLAVGRVQRARG